MLLLKSLVIGMIATLFMDIVAWIRKRFFGIPSLDYRLVGRWVLYMSKGKFAHHTILQTPQMSGEVALGWFIHYLIGVIFALILLLVVSEIGLISAVLMGLMTTIFPLFIMQPAFGFGVLASKTPAPKIACIRSFIAHFSFGVGLYLASVLVAQF